MEQGNSLPSAKELKKLADACRKAGIKSFKGYGIEFTLSDEAPVSDYKRKAKKDKQVQQDTSQDPEFESDSLTEEQILFYSVQDVMGDGSGRASE